jgi:hypothetical protein
MSPDPCRSIPPALTDLAFMIPLAAIACMRIEGWGITRPPMQFVPRE